MFFPANTIYFSTANTSSTASLHTTTIAATPKALAPFKDFFSLMQLL